MVTIHITFPDKNHVAFELLPPAIKPNPLWRKVCRLWNAFWRGAGRAMDSDERHRVVCPSDAFHAANFLQWAKEQPEITLTKDEHG